MHKIFLSSTSRDLKAYRDAVREAILGLDGYQMVAMEHFNARTERPRDFCNRLAQDSDLFVGLLGHYYGSCPPGEQVSFTELEYRSARAKNWSRLMFIAPDDFPIPASLREPDESFQRQQAFRKEVLDELVTASFATPEQLASKVTASIANWAQGRERSNEAREEPAKGQHQLGPNPYRGLEAFRKEDADRFFGREALVQELWERFLALHAPARDGEARVRLLAILGPSGTGKSSVAQAGLLAKLDRDPLPGRPSPTSVVFTPEARPLESLATALVRQATNVESPARAIADFEHTLRDRADHDGLRFLAARLLDASPGGVVILADQFEEVFALCQDESEREKLISNLLNASSEPRGRVSIILTLGSDFLGAVGHSDFMRVIAGQNVVVPVMGPEALRRAIEEPAKHAGREIDPGTIDVLVEQALGREGALPLLEFVLTRIWEGMQRGVAAADALRELGGVGGALANQAQAVYDLLKSEEQQIARRAFLAMVRPGDATRDIRRRASLAEMATQEYPEERILAVLRRFSEPECRLISLSGGGDRIMAEIAHETLIDHWRLLRDWVDAAREDVRLRKRLEEAAMRWERLNHASAALWGPRELGLLREHRARAVGSDMTLIETTFIDASERKNRINRSLRRAGIAAASCGLLSVFVGQAIFSNQQVQVALRNKSLFLAALSERKTTAGDPVDGILLALEALPSASEPRLPYVFSAEEALYRAVVKYRESPVLQGHKAPVLTAAFGPGGRQLVTASDDDTARLWDARSGEPIAILQGHGAPVLSAVFSPDGSELVTASDDDTARLWDARSGEPIAILQGHGAPVLSAVFSPDGSEVVTASDDDTARLWNARSGEPIAILQGHEAPVLSAVFSPDGSEVVTASADHNARLWRASSGEPIAILKGHEAPVFSAAFNPNGSKVVTASSDRSARLWDAASGDELALLQGHEGRVGSAAFSPDGSKVVTASDDHTARLWDADNGQLLAILRGHQAPVVSAVFSPDGSKVVTASDDDTARLWDADSGELLAILRGHEAPVFSAVFSPDGSEVVTASDDNTARLWPVFGTTQGLVDYAKRIVPRQLTPVQRKQFFLE